jgi:hypothetical protein
MSAPYGPSQCDTCDQYVENLCDDCGLCIDCGNCEEEDV